MSPGAFPTSEHRARVQNAQLRMNSDGFDALLLTTAPEMFYFTGFLTRFWESPSRPWFLLIPAQGDPIAVIPAIGAYLMGQTWISDIRCWDSPHPTDDGVTLLADTLTEATPTNARIAMPMGPESVLRMPLTDFTRLQTKLGTRQICSDDGLTSALRAVKSEAEVTRIRTACAIADRAFARVPEILRPGHPLATVFRDFQSLCLQEGADGVPYLAGASAPGGYGDVISPATDAPVALGDVVMLDTGLTRDGYFCDFDRNFSVGPAPDATRRAHDTLIAATRAGFEAARPGATAADLHRAMMAITGPMGGRFGHGLGLQLTEGLSLLPTDHSPLCAGMVLTLEPSVSLGGDRLMVHEENIVIRENGAEWLSTPATDLMEVS